MIKDKHVDQRQRDRDPFRDQLVGVGLIFYAARMIMKEHARGSSLLKRQLHDFAGIDACTGGLAQASLVDLVIRSAPRGSQGTMMMLFYALYYFSIRFGDLFGTWIYDKHGGFIPTVVITIIVYALILPVILLVPTRLTATKDGEAMEA